ncbi:hypothetical protein CspeluHIS016_0802170 [Cutaneotrichosporon spelunceum]|uniref:Uncharacterized protein n=1 Tax=Cutaneotrichosporon spelunceum TaxID=1672016 RepID=A0AAD3TZU3_9TREE|nr:hypothetical protein CspeluHIS016_0802170 [Cutaneotrichosporon spelunceum]
MDDHRARYNVIACTVWERTQAGDTDFTDFHDILLALIYENEIIEAIRYEFDQRFIALTDRLGQHTDLKDFGLADCFRCLDAADTICQALDDLAQAVFNMCRNYEGRDKDQGQNKDSDKLGDFAAGMAKLCLDEEDHTAAEEEEEEEEL